MKMYEAINGIINFGNPYDLIKDLALACAVTEMLNRGYGTEGENNESK
jgi:hypothetical protein